MPPSPALTHALCETYRAHAALGNESIAGPNCIVLRNDDAPIVYDANVLMPGPKADVATAFAFQDEALSDRPYRNVQTDPFTPPAFGAELSLRGYAINPTLQLLLEGDLLGPAPGEHDLRLAESDADWAVLTRLFRADHIKTDKKNGTNVYTEALTDQMVGVHRRASAEINFYQAWVDGEAVAFFSSWPGRNGVGMVEDLFTLPAYRNRGIARALIHHCVSDARARGAGPVLIGAEPDDTPKNLYAGLGFAPTCMTYGWVKSGD